MQIKRIGIIVTNAPQDVTGYPLQGNDKMQSTNSRHNALESPWGLFELLWMKGQECRLGFAAMQGRVNHSFCLPSPIICLVQCMTEMITRFSLSFQQHDVRHLIDCYSFNNKDGNIGLFRSTDIAANI